MQAEQEHAKVIVINLDTPGGLDSSMRGINEAIITSSVPVITYVTPSGARAASAGVYIMYASHIAAMAPGTNIGAASPISLFASSNSNNLTTEERKTMNDSAAYIRSLAQLRNRNADWAETAVKQAVSIPADEAKKLNVIDIIADNPQQLLQQANDRIVIVNGGAEKLSTNNLNIETVPQGWRYEFLSLLTDPNVAYILMLIAIYGIFFEFANPGMVLPGVTGVIALVLMLYAFQLMPINYTGLILVMIGVVFMLFEVYVSSFGVIGIGGIIAFVLGSIMLFDESSPTYHLAWQLVLVMSITSAAFFFMVVGLAIKSYRKAVVTGREGLIGSEGVVLNNTDKQIVVRVLGEIWNAKSSHHDLASGQKIKVTKIDGLVLTVEPDNKRQKSV